MKTIENYHLHLKAARLAPSTISVYITEFSQYLTYFKGKDIRYITREQILEYISRLYDTGYSASKVNQAINAIKFYKEKIRNEKRKTYYIKRPHEEKFIPTILTPETIRKIIDAPRFIKHRAILYFIYHNGLRISEAINATLMDFRSKQESPQLIIRKTKYNKSRIIPVTDECVDVIREYYLACRPKTFLFEGATPGQKISKSTIRNILKKACKKCGVKERLRVHDLRHNFVTHCLKQGTSLHHMSPYLGHKWTQTTEKYYSHLLPADIVIKRPETTPGKTRYLKAV